MLRPFHRPRPGKGLLSALLALILVASAAGAQETYRIGPGDSLDISIFGQSDLSGVHTVRPNGEIVLHLLGGIPVAGLDLHEMEARIVEQASALFQTAPSVVVDIARYRDVFVLGAVDRPGVYPFRPGMTAMMAIASAGGLQRASAPSGDAQAGRLLTEQRQSLLARDRIAALESEIGAIDREIGRFQGGEPAGDAGALIVARRQILDVQLRAIDQTATLAGEEADLLARSQTLLEGRLERVDAALADARARLAGGYFPPERLAQLQAEADSAREDLLDASAASARARRAAAAALSDAALVQARYVADLLSQKTDAERALAEERVRLQTSVEYLAQFGAMDAVAEAGAGPVERLTLTRSEAGALNEIEATRATRLLPDDVLNVEVTFPSVEGEAD